MFLPAIKIATFVLATLGIGYVSRASLPHPRSHGFYRFFAWETILVQTLLVIEGWFKAPLAWYQLISWVLLIIGLYLVIHGVWLLKQVGQQDSQRSDSPMLSFEKTTQLVTIGAYKYIRHPLYSSLLFLAWGVFFKSPSWLGLILALISTLFLFLTAKAEEAEDIRFFGPVYQDYIQHSRMFIPFVF